MGWGGVGWDNNVHVPVHTQARQPHHLSCCPAGTGTALSSSVTAGVGWGGIITLMLRRKMMMMTTMTTTMMMMT